MRNVLLFNELILKAKLQIFIHNTNNNVYVIIITIIIIKRTQQVLMKRVCIISIISFLVP